MTTTPQTSAGRVSTDSAGRGSLPGSQSARPAGIHPAAAAMSERQLEDGVRRILADLPSVIWYHTRDSRRSPEGFPDLVAVCRGVMFRELKSEKGKLTKAQQEWLDALTNAGGDAGVWRPSALLSGQIARELAALAGIGGGM